MSKKIKILTSFLLVIVMTFQNTACLFADSVSQNQELYNKISYSSDLERGVITNAILHPTYINYDSFDFNDKNVIDSVASNPDRFLNFAGIFNDQVVILYNTNIEGVHIGITDGYIEIIRKIDNNTISVNGETSHFYVDSPSIPATIDSNKMNNRVASGWLEISSLTGQSWGTPTYKWHDVILENAIASHTIALLAYIFAESAGLPVGGSLLVGLASGLINSIYSDQYHAALGVYTYFDLTTGLPLLWYRKDVCYGYGYNRSNDTYVYIDTEVKYYFANL